MALERQGAYWSVLSDMLRELAHLYGVPGPPSGWGGYAGLSNLAILRTRRLALAWDAGLSPRGELLLWQLYYRLRRGRGQKVKGHGAHYSSYKIANLKSQFEALKFLDHQPADIADNLV